MPWQTLSVCRQSSGSGRRLPPLDVRSPTDMLGRYVLKMKMQMTKMMVESSASSALMAWSTSCMLVAIALRSRPYSVTVRIISSRLMSPLPSRSRAAKHSSASLWRPDPMTSSRSSWYRLSLPSTTNDSQMRRASASAERLRSRASMTIECAELTSNTFLPVISWATDPNTVAVSCCPCEACTTHQR